MRIQVAAFLLAFTTTLGPVMSQGASAVQTVPAASSTAAPAARAGGSTAGSDTGTAAGGQAQQDFTISNYSGHTIASVQLSPTSENSWGQNILGGDTLANGESAQINFYRGETQCVWDIKATYDDGGITDMRNVNLCEVASVALTAD